MLILKLLLILVALHILGCSSDTNPNESRKAMGETVEEKLRYISEKGNTGDLDEADGIARYLDDDDAEVKGSACFYLGYLGARSYLKIVLEQLNPDDNDVTNLCLSGLALMAGESEGYLFERITPYMSSESKLVRMGAADVLGAIANANSEGFLLSVFKNEVPAVQAQIVLALAKVGGYESIPVLRSFLQTVQGMDKSAPRRGGVRGVAPHPTVLEHVTLEAIQSILARAESKT